MKNHFTVLWRMLLPLCWKTSSYRPNGTAKHALICGAIRGERKLGATPGDGQSDLKRCTSTLAISNHCACAFIGMAREMLLYQTSALSLPMVRCKVEYRGQASWQHGECTASCRLHHQEMDHPS